MADHWDVMEPVPHMTDVDFNDWAIYGAAAEAGYLWVLLYHTTTGLLRFARYDQATDAWTELSDIPNALAHQPGGNGVYFPTMGTEFLLWDRQWVVAYDFVADSWRGLPNDPAVETDNAAGAVSPIDGKAYFFGGYRSFALGGYEIVRSFDMDTETWDDNVAPSESSYVASGNNQHTGGVLLADGRCFFRRGQIDITASHDSFQYRYHFPPTNQIDHLDIATYGNIGSIWEDRQSWGTCGEFVWSVGGFSWISSDATADCYYWNPDTFVRTQIANHPLGDGVHSCWVRRLGDYMWTIGGAFGTDRRAKSLCRYTPSFPLIDLDPSEGWGAHW
jgi:hypothetical protein